MQFCACPHISARVINQKTKNFQCPSIFINGWLLNLHYKESYVITQQGASLTTSMHFRIETSLDPLLQHIAVHQHSVSHLTCEWKGGRKQTLFPLFNYVFGKEYQQKSFL